MWTRIPYSARIGLPVRQYVGEAARNRFCHHGKTQTEKNGKNHTERYGIPNFRRFRKSLATSSCILPTKLEALFRGLSKWCDHRHGSSIITAVCEDLPHLSDGEIGQSGKSRFVATPGNSLKKMGACNHGPSHRPIRVQWLYGYCGLCGQTEKNGTSRLLDKRGDSHGICQNLCGSHVLNT